MSKESDQFVKEMKASKKLIGDLSIASGEKKQKALIAHLEKTWDAEDVLQEAIQKAHLGGITSKKSKDYVGHPDVVKALKAWQQMLKAHHKNLADFKTFHDDAKEYHKIWSKKTEVVEKGLKKNSGMGDMAAMALIKDTKRKTLPDLAKSRDLYGSLKSFVVLYGTNYQRTIDAVVKDALAAVTPKEFPASLGEDKRRKTTKDLKNIPKAINKICKAAEAAMADGKMDVAEATLAKAEKELDTLAGYVKDGKTTTGKMKKELKEHKDSKVITKLITDINKAHKTYTAKIDDLEKKIEEKQKELAK